MGKVHLSFLTALAVAFLAAVQTQAQPLFAQPTPVFSILSTGMGTRGPAMGESFTAVADDASALYYNPAGLGNLSRPEVYTATGTYLPTGFTETTAYVQPLRVGGALAFSAQYLNHGTNSIGLVVEDIGASVAYGFPLVGKLAMGLRAEWFRQGLSGTPLQGLLGDAGFMAGPFDHLYFGLDLKNMGLETGGSALPLELLSGISYRAGLEAPNTDSLTLSLGQDLLFQSTMKLNAGIEYSYIQKFFVRIGLTLDVEKNPAANTSGFSLGAGLSLGQVRLDYAYSVVGGQGDLHRVSLALLLPPMGRSQDTARTPAEPSSPVPAPKGPHAPDQTVVMKFEMADTASMPATQLLKLGLEKEKLGLSDEAIDLYLKAVGKDEKLSKGWDRLGKLYLEKSLESYRRALKLDPQDKALRDLLRKLEP